MNVLLLGNGFDINCGLPTKYINFLQIVDFLDHHRENEYKTIGELFKAMNKENVKSSVNYFYSTEKQELMDIYDNIKLNADDIREILTIKSKDETKDIRNNMWFSYFSKNHLVDINWVGFEKEMEQVLIDLNKYKTTVNSNDMDDIKMYCDPEFSEGNQQQTPECQRIVNELKQFSIPLPCCYYTFFPLEIEKKVPFVRFKSKTESYLDADGNIQWDKIYDCFEQDRLDLVQVFKNYLTYFVEKISDNQSFIAYANKQSAFLCGFNRSDIVINFNYTRTFEKLSLRLFDINWQQIDFSKCPIRCFHIHGRVDGENIVMGIKPNDDGIEPLHFQKDVQRFRYGTNSGCIAWLRSVDKDPVDKLTVMGCSLDVTDGDIIKKLFYKSQLIKLVYYADDDALYCKNIKSILGTDGLEKLQERFVFKKIADCQTEYSNSMHRNYVEYIPGHSG